MLGPFPLREGEDTVEYHNHKDRDAQLRQPRRRMPTPRDPEKQRKEVDHLRSEGAPPRRWMLHGKAIRPAFGQQAGGLIRRQAEFDYSWHFADPRHVSTPPPGRPMTGPSPIGRGGSQVMPLATGRHADKRPGRQGLQSLVMAVAE